MFKYIKALSLALILCGFTTAATAEQHHKGKKHNKHSHSQEHGKKKSCNKKSKDSPAGKELSKFIATQKAAGLKGTELKKAIHQEKQRLGMGKGCKE